MKRNFLLLFLLIFVLANACSKPGIDKLDTEENYASIAQIPEKLFAGGDLYGAWKIDSVKTISGHYYKGGQNVLIAFTNDGKIVIENNNRIELKHVESYAPDWKIYPWYFASVVEKYRIVKIEPSNEISLSQGYPYTGSFAFKDNDESWYAYFSNQKMWLYQWASGNAQVSIWARKINKSIGIF